MFLLLCVASSPAALAQKQGGSNGTYYATREAPASPARPLTLDEGLAILNAALDSRHHAGFTSDCSHFVHGLYQRAGFPYEYASSSDLYAGIDEFRRVTNPQPGDLAVWRGHAGIVVNPAQYSFFSLLRSGPGVDTYDSPYWRHRGRPRFFRYVKAIPRSRSGSLRSASLNPAIEEVPDGQDETSTEGLDSTGPAASRIVNTEIPRVVVVQSAHPQPEHVDAAFLRACADLENVLRGRDLFESAQPVIVFDHFTVSKLHTSGNQGWADVQIDEVFFFVDGKAQARRGLERQRWPLSRRDKTSWELRTPRGGTIYLPQNIAVRIMSHQLAQLTEERPDTTAKPKQKAELVRVLALLMPE